MGNRKQGRGVGKATTLFKLQRQTGKWASLEFKTTYYETNPAGLIEASVGAQIQSMCLTLRLLHCSSRTSADGGFLQKHVSIVLWSHGA